MITQFKLYEAIGKEKIDFEWSDEDKTYKFKNITTYVSYNFVPMMGVSQVIRQYIKQKWSIPFQISSESYSGGDSIRIYLNPMEMSEQLRKEITDDLSSSFQRGEFDGMTDSYNSREPKISTMINGENVKFGVKYIFIENKPKFGTKEWEKNIKWKNMNDDAEKYNL